MGKPIEMKLGVALFAFTTVFADDAAADEVKPAFAGDDGKWTKCGEPAAVENGFVRCKKDQCMLKCADGFMVDGSPKTKCKKGDDDTFAFTKDLGSCVACPDEGCPEMEKPEKPSGDKPSGGKPTGDKPSGDKPSGGKPTGDKPSGDKPSGDKPSGDKPSGDKPSGGKPTGGKPDGDNSEKPAFSGDDGKWNKCEQPAEVANGRVKCKKDQCVLKCNDGFMANGSQKMKCQKDDDGNFAFNKVLGTCDACPDEGCPEEEKPSKPTGGKPTGGKPTGDKPSGDKPTGEKPPAGECKDFATMLGEDSVLTATCAENDAGKMACDVQCPDGQFFMGKDGKTGTSVVCKCKGSKCKWANSKKKTVNGKMIAKWMCE